MSPGVTRQRLELGLGLTNLGNLILILILTVRIILNLKTIDISGLS